MVEGLKLQKLNFVADAPLSEQIEVRIPCRYFRGSLSGPRLGSAKIIISCPASAQAAISGMNDAGRPRENVRKGVAECFSTINNDIATATIGKYREMRPDTDHLLTPRSL